MTPEERAEATQAVVTYRRAAARIRRNDTSTFDMAAIPRMFDADIANANAMAEAQLSLTALGLDHVSTALGEYHDALCEIASARDNGRPYERWPTRLRGARRVIRTAVSTGSTAPPVRD
jgi:hypothetical protein